ncbi:RNA helicase [Sarracenia purpurea var. burkii]
MKLLFLGSRSNYVVMDGGEVDVINWGSSSVGKNPCTSLGGQGFKSCHMQMPPFWDALNKSNFENYSSRARDSVSCWTPDCIGFNLIEAVLCHICRKERPGAVLVFMTGWEDISCLRDQLKAHPLLGDPNRVSLLTCHGSMATSEQVRTF